jgi:xanthosine utilization system XapX-like protein
MALLDKENLEGEAAQRATYRVHHVGTKLNEGELRSLVALADKRRQTQGELIRGLVLGEIERDRQPAPEVRPSVELVEIAALRLQIMNLLKPVLAGKPMTVESFDAIMREVKGHKRRVAPDVLRDYQEKV